MADNRRERFLNALDSWQSFQFGEPRRLNPRGDGRITFRHMFYPRAVVTQCLLKSVGHVASAHLDEQATLRVASQTAGTVRRETEGLRLIAGRVHRYSQILAAGLKQLGHEVINECYFDTLVIHVPNRAAFHYKQDDPYEWNINPMFSKISGLCMFNK